LKSASESADETHRLYRAGRESFISDLDATRTLTSTKSQVAAAEGQVAIDQVNLFLALGGGWEMDADARSAPGVTAPHAATPAKAVPAAAAATAAKAP
jgi:outer membrane protein TolC